MKVKRPIFAILMVFLVYLMSSVTKAVNTRPIDGVLQKGVLNSQDLQIIDNFIDEAVRELVETKDFTGIAQIRTAILSRQSNQAQYAEQFYESAHKHIYSALQEASKLTPEEHRVIITTNLLILIDGLENLQLADLAIGKLNDKNTIVRYWATHCLTNPSIITKLNAGGTLNLKLARNIVSELNKPIESSSPEIIVLIAKFAADVNIPEAEGLLLQIADMRIKRYTDWTVEYELLDGAILKSLSSKITTTEPGESQATNGSNPAARCFGQLYSYVIQRYAKGKGLLSDTQKNQLASVIVETEDKCISKLMGKTQMGIKRAIEQENTTALLQEHDRLLGDETTQGQLPLKLKFDYGNTDGSRNRTAPLDLPEPPKKNSEK